MNGGIPPAAGDLPAGARVASYRIEQLIGRGGMATVYRVTDVRLDRQVALKVLIPDLARNESFRQRFIQESRAGASLDHPHVIPVFEAGEADGILFIAMRYVAGHDVRALIAQQGHLPTGRAVGIVTQIAAALDAAHAQGLVHRDVKPANMLLAQISDSTADDYVYLSDFGLSKLSVASTSLTGTGQFLGTLDYMSPEQIGGQAIDGRTDLYALGCAAFEMLTGEPPFRREANLAVMWAQVSAQPPSVRQRRPDLAPQVDAVIARALAKSPDDRYPSCTEFAETLAAACAIPAVGLPPGTPATVAPITDETISRISYDSPTPYGSPAPVPGGQVAVPGGYQPGSGHAPAGPEYGAPAPGGPGQAPQGGPGYGPGGQGYPAGYPAGGPAGPRPGQAIGPYVPGGPGGYPPRAPPPRRGLLLPILIGVLIIVILASVGLTVLHLSGSGKQQANPRPTSEVTAGPSASGPGTTTAAPSSSPSRSSSPAPPTVTGPAATVKAYYRAVNTHKYAQAWQINVSAHALSDYATFKAGFTGTQDVVLTIGNVAGNVVSVSFIAYQTNGTQKDYSGTYTVQSGQIVSSSIQQTN